MSLPNNQGGAGLSLFDPEWQVGLTRLLAQSAQGSTIIPTDTIAQAMAATPTRSQSKMTPAAQKNDKIDFKSNAGRILQTDALNMLDQIIVKVGNTGIAYPVLESVIRKSSKFFDNAMKPEWASARPDPRVVDLSDEEPEVFGIYIHWLYFRTFPTVTTVDLGPNSPEALLLCKCYIMGDKLMDPTFKNATLKALVDATHNQPHCNPRIPGPGSIKSIYEGTTGGSPARKLIVDLWVAYVGESSLIYLTEQLPHGFVLEFSRALVLSKCKAKDTRSWYERIEDYLED